MVNIATWSHNEQILSIFDGMKSGLDNCSNLVPITMRTIPHTPLGVDTPIGAVKLQKSSFLGPKTSKIWTIMSNANFLLIFRAILLIQTFKFHALCTKWPRKCSELVIFALLMNKIVLGSNLENFRPRLTNCSFLDPRSSGKGFHVLTLALITPRTSIGS